MSVESSGPGINSFYQRYSFYRDSVGLPPAPIDAQLSAAARLHCIYLVKNHLSGGDASIVGNHLEPLQPDRSVHTESPGNRYFTAAGANAAGWSFIVRGSILPADAAPLVDDAMTMPFGAMWVLNPQVAELGYGAYCEGKDCASIVTFRMGLPRAEFIRLFDVPGTFWNPAQGNVSWVREPLRRAIEFPAPDSKIGLTGFSDLSVPGPITSCPGFGIHAGLPITLQLGAAYTGAPLKAVKAGRVRLLDNGSPEAACVIDETSFRSSNPLVERSGRYQLHMLGAVIVVPKDSLKAGHQYQVSIDADGRTFGWRFGVSPIINSPSHKGR
ncbi:MAG: hypothetical protein ACREQI_00030 [Candidatus Binataceae bacterium]